MRRARNFFKHVSRLNNVLVRRERISTIKHFPIGKKYLCRSEKRMKNFALCGYDTDTRTDCHVWILALIDILCMAKVDAWSFFPSTAVLTIILAPSITVTFASTYSVG